MRIEVGVRDRHRPRPGTATRTRSSWSPPLYVVADGMGGHRGGQVASRRWRSRRSRGSSTEGTGLLADHVREANRAVWDRSVEDERLSGMGTTLTAARIDGASALIAHVGDSRAYLLRDGALRQLTEDHTLVARMVKSGEITEAEAEVHPHKNVLTRAARHRRAGRGRRGLDRAARRRPPRCSAATA